MPSRRKIRRQHAADRFIAEADARQLAADLRNGGPAVALDTRHTGLILEPGEIAYRQIPASFAQYVGHGLTGWTLPTPVTLTLTNNRIIGRHPAGPVLSLWWQPTRALHIDLNAETVVLDYGEHIIRRLTGPTTPVLAVLAVAALHGLDDLNHHPALTTLALTPPESPRQPAAPAQPALPGKHSPGRPAVEPSLADLDAYPRRTPDWLPEV
jgi:hypothetical protein